jgi:hypothetical protein
MTSRKNCLSLIGGVAAFLLVLTPNAFAKHSSTGGQAEVPCGDGTITYSPVTLWPPNHKMETIGISFAETHPEGVSDPAPETLGLQVTAISSNQDAVDAAGGSGCGKDTAPGDDWSFNPLLVLGTAGDDTVTVLDPVTVAAERCAKIKSARVYTIDVTCTDEGGTDSAVLTVTVAHDKGKKH